MGWFIGTWIKSRRRAYRASPERRCDTAQINRHIFRGLTIMASRKKPSKGRRGAAKPSHSDLMGQIAAIHRSQAVLELEMDGKIIWANENFLNVFGYTLEEIQGKSHSMLVHPAIVQSAE